MSTKALLNLMDGQDAAEVIRISFPGIRRASVCDNRFQVRLEEETNKILEPLILEKLLTNEWQLAELRN